MGGAEGGAEGGGGRDLLCDVNVLDGVELRAERSNAPEVHDLRASTRQRQILSVGVGRYRRQAMSAA
eukprot:3097166-Rhodomonas_salina.1